MTQAALRFVLAQPRMACVVPTITSLAELEEFAAAASAPELTDDELARVHELYRSGFGLAAGAAAG
jgi:aryl-alcohol dehydrogenase-like predicted oxidoreductase